MTLTSALLRLCNEFVASGDGWLIPLGDTTWLVDDWRPGRAVRPALALGFEVASTPFVVHVDEHLANSWFRGVSWSTMSPAVRADYVEYRAKSLLAWLEGAMGAPVRVTGVDENPVDEAPVDECPDADTSRIEGHAARAAGHHLDWRVQRQGTMSDPHAIDLPSAGRLSLGLVDAPALERLAPLVASLHRHARTRHAPDRAAPARQGEAGAIDFDLLVARVRLPAAGLLTLTPGDLLLPPALKQVAAATGKTAAATEIATATAAALPLSICLGRTPVRAAALERNGIRFGQPLDAAAAPLSSGDSPMPSESQAESQAFELDVTLRFGQMRMTLAQLGAVRVGQLIETGASGDEPEVDLLVDGRVLGRGRLVRIGQDWGVSVLSWQVGGNGK